MDRLSNICSFKMHLFSTFLGWGMSETSPLGLLSSLSQIVEGSCGVVTPNTECKIVDVSTGDNLPPHKTGELCIRGPQIMKGKVF